MVHAGWRGLAAGIVDRVLDRVRGGTPVAAVGPAIGPCHYEVGEDVAEAVADGSPARPSWSGAGEGSSSISRPRWRRCFAGAAWPMSTWPECTACHPERFFSPKDGVTGRQAVVALLA